MAKKNEYFDTFQTLVDFSCQAAKELQTSLQEFDPMTLQGKMESMHEIEHNADDEKHTMMTKLAQEFVTPIEREDIILLANEIDEVIDKIEDVLMRIYMYNIKAIRPEALAFTDVIVRCTMALQVAMAEFYNFHKSKEIKQCIIDVNTMEEEGDALYIEAMRTLYTSDADAVTIVAWSETFDRLEECCDACEHVANVMESVMMKNA
ncbi:DUF47 family protein [Ruminococcaceae bacterium OttesenSCG-928-A16]|nr:DUF47 family protein [Ruminococcaceae bacterium OttesenSCG-928-A16]